jgi:glyoxylase-like metal-dependent hydrolase (beta-lactamase superfamily II)
MTPHLVFDRSLDAPYGVPVRLSPLVTRLLAPNPGPFTFKGTGVYILGAGRDAMVIDPGPAIPRHLDALKAALAGRRVSHILITHAHADHSPAARPLAAWSGAEVYAAPSGSRESEDASVVEEGFDPAFAPDVILRDGDVIAGAGVTVTAVATPGHTANHMCYALAQEQALFTGDHVMGWSTSVVAPPDGDMAAYMASLEKLIARRDAILYPTHGSPVPDPRAYLEALLAHRRAREAQVLAALPATIPDLVARLYAGLDPKLAGAAAQSVAAHLIKLRDEGRAREDAGVWR